MSRQISESRADNRWGTYNQIRQMGGQIRKGEQGTRVLLWKQATPRAARDEKGKVRKDQEGRTIYEDADCARPIVRQYTVFNVEQAEGLKLEPAHAVPQPEWEIHRETERVLRAAGAKIEHVAGGDRAFYRMDEDRIVLPDPGQFESRTGYYQTASHEAGHSTGHPSRMNRESLQEGIKQGFGSPEYAREELRAEISAMMTGEQVGVGHDPKRGAAYVENWIQVFEEDPFEIQRFWCRQPTEIVDNEIWRTVKRNGILSLPDVDSKTTSFFSASAGIFASN